MPRRFFSETVAARRREQIAGLVFALKFAGAEPRS